MKLPKRHNQTRPVRLPLFTTVLLLPLLIMGCKTISTGNECSFLDQKGMLSWPSEGAVAESFGKEVDPVYGTETFNPGILISTQPSAEVKSVFDGEVVEVYTMPELGHVISISHCEYVSIYGNLSSHSVSAGMAVKAGQLIGTSGAKDEPKGESVFFALFKEEAEINPESWLKSR